MAARHFVVTVHNGFVSCQRAAKKPAYERHKDYSGVGGRYGCFYDGSLDEQDAAAAGDFLVEVMDLKTLGKKEAAKKKARMAGQKL